MSIPAPLLRAKRSTQKKWLKTTLHVDFDSTIYKSNGRMFHQKTVYFVIVVVRSDLLRLI